MNSSAVYVKELSLSRKAFSLEGKYQPFQKRFKLYRKLFYLLLKIVAFPSCFEKMYVKALSFVLKCNEDIYIMT